MGSILRRLAVRGPNLSNVQSTQSTHLLFVQLNAFRTITKLSSAKKDELQRSFLERAISIAVKYGDKLRVTAGRKPSNSSGIMDLPRCISLDWCLIVLSFFIMNILKGHCPPKWNFSTPLDLLRKIW
ncbi:hypothetical protein Dimus_028531 [Dionaea muscipula]